MPMNHESAQSNTLHRQEYGKEFANSISKTGQEISQYLKKTAGKRYRDIFKDIEIKKRDFFLLALIGQSLSAIIILDIIGFLRSFQTVASQSIGTGAIGGGLIVGLVLSSVILRRLEHRYPLLTVLFIFSLFAQFSSPFLNANETLTIIQYILMGINGFIFGMGVVIYTTLFIEYTNIMERGRIIALNFMCIFATGLVQFFLAIMAQFLSLVVAIVPILAIIFFWKIRTSEKINPKRLAPVKEANFLEMLKMHKSLFFYGVILFAFAFSIGLFFPLTDIGLLILGILPSNRVLLIIVVSLVLSAIMLFIVGYAYDFVGRRFTLGVSATIIGVVNYIQMYFIPDFDPIVIAITFLVTLIMAVPLIVGDYSSIATLARNNASILLISILGLIIGVLMQRFIVDSSLAGGTALVLSILVLFVLLNTKELISPQEQLWFEDLYHLYVIHESGILLYEHSFRGNDKGVEPDLVSGGIIGLTMMLQEIMRGNQQLRVIDHGDKKLLFRFSSDTKVVFVLLSEEDLLVLRNKLGAFAEDFEQQFASKLMDLNGIKMADWEPTKEIVQRHFERKYFSLA